MTVCIHWSFSVQLSDYSNSSFDSDSFTDSDTETDTDSSWTTEGENGGTASFSDEQEWTVLSDGDEEHWSVYLACTMSNIQCVVQ